MILGIDQSLQATGLCLLHDNGEIMKLSTVHTDDLRGPSRIAYVLDCIDKMIDEAGGDCTVAREGYSYGSKSSSLYEIGELGGCINYSIWLRRSGTAGGSVRIMHILPPTTVKKFCLGSGSIKKDTGYLLKVKDKFGIGFADDNMADAYMIATMTRKFQQIIDGEIELKELEEYEKESLLAPSVRKRLKLTPAKIKKLSDEELLKLAKQSFNSVYKVFEVK